MLVTDVLWRGQESDEDEPRADGDLSCRCVRWQVLNKALMLSLRTLCEQPVIIPLAAKRVFTMTQYYRDDKRLTRSQSRVKLSRRVQ